MNKKSKLLEGIFAPAVDGGCSDAYRIVLLTLGGLPIEAKRISFTLNELYQALLPLSDKWQKEIDKATS